MGTGSCSRAHPDEDDVGRLDGHVSARADGNAHVSLRQGWGVVHAVAHHGHSLPLVLQLLDFGHLVRRQHLCKDFVDANLKGKRNGPGLRSQYTITSGVARGQQQEQKPRSHPKPTPQQALQIVRHTANAPPTPVPMPPPHPTLQRSSPHADPVTSPKQPSLAPAGGATLPAWSCKGLSSFPSPPHSDWGPPLTQASSPLEGVPVCQAEG